MRNNLITLTLTILLIFSILTSLQVGSVSIDLLSILNGKASNSVKYIFYEVRLPRTLATLLGGTSLAISGLVLQTLFRNPLVDPYIIGIAGGSTFFMGLTLLLGISMFGVFPNMPLYLSSSIIGALITLTIITVLAPKLSITQLLIIGIVINYLYHAGITLIMTIAEIERIAQFHIALLGSFSGSSWIRVEVSLIPILTCTVLSIIFSKWLTPLIMGEAYAHTMGVNVKFVRTIYITLTGILTALTVYLAGIVGFIGLAAPHIARLLYRTNRVDYLIIPTILIGSLLTTCSDITARILLTPRELPITAITSLFGAPLLAYLIVRLRREYAW